MEAEQDPQQSFQSLVQLSDPLERLCTRLGRVISFKKGAQVADLAESVLLAWPSCMRKDDRPPVALLESLIGGLMHVDGRILHLDET